MIGALCQLILHSRVRCHVLQDMGVAACENLVPVPLETRGRVSHLDADTFSQWCATEATVSLKKKKAKKNSRDHRSVCLSPLGGPTLSSWDILDLEIIAVNPSLPGDVAIKYQLKIIELNFYMLHLDSHLNSL